MATLRLSDLLEGVPGVRVQGDARTPIKEVRDDSRLVAPGPLQLHAFFAEMKAAGCTDAVLEASSHALEQGRVHGCAFRVAALTNVTQDHLDYHGTHESYFAA